MLVLLLHLSTSVFAPLVSRDWSPVTRIIQTELNVPEMMKKTIILATTPADSSNASATFEKLASVFSDIDFVSLDLGSQSTQSEIYVVENGTFVSAFDYRSELDDFLAFITNWRHGYQRIQDVSSLQNRISALPFTVVVREPKVLEFCANLTRDIVKKFIWQGQIFVAPPEVFKELNYADSEVLIYRRADHILIDLAETQGVEDAVRPYFVSFDEISGRATPKVAVAIVGYDRSIETDTSLIEAARKYRQFVFGYASPRWIAKVRDMIDPYVSLPSKCVIGISFVEGFGYQPLEIGVLDYVEKMLSGNLKRTYKSEPIPSTFTGVLVGNTYQKYIEERTTDVMVLYYNDEELHWFSSLRDTLKSANVELYMINVSKNSSPLRFPQLLGIPHVEFFPKELTAPSIALLEYPTEASILRFAHENCGSSDKIEFVPRTFNEVRSMNKTLRQLEQYSGFNATLDKYRPIVAAELESAPEAEEEDDLVYDYDDDDYDSDDLESTDSLDDE